MSPCDPWVSLAVWGKLDDDDKGGFKDFLFIHLFGDDLQF